MWYRNKIPDDEFHIPFREEKKSFLLIIMNLISLWKLKKTNFLDWIYQKFYPIFGRLGVETSTESLEICHLKLLLFFLQSTIQKTINWWSIFFGDAAKKHKQIYITFIKQRYKLGWFINRSKYNKNPCKLIIYRFWITIIDVMVAWACCGLVVPNEILTQYLKRKEVHISRHSGLE